MTRFERRIQRKLFIHRDRVEKCLDVGLACVIGLSLAAIFWG